MLSGPGALLHGSGAPGCNTGALIAGSPASRQSRSAPHCLTGCGWHRTSAWTREAPLQEILGIIPPKKRKNKRGKRSALSTLTRQERGSVRRAEQIIARAEQAHQEEEEERRAARARGSTRPTGPSRRTERPNSPEQGPTDDQRRRIVLRSLPREPVRLEERKDPPEDRQLRLRSVAPGLQQKRIKAEQLRLAVNTAKNRWEGSRYRTRVQLLSGISKKAPRGSVTQSILGQFGDPCSTCDERDTASKPVRAEFAQKRLKRKDQGSERTRKRSYEIEETDADRRTSSVILETALTRARRRITASRKKVRETANKEKETRPFPRIREVLIQEEGEEEDPGSDVDFSPGDASPKGHGGAAGGVAAPIAAGGN